MSMPLTYNSKDPEFADIDCPKQAPVWDAEKCTSNIVRRGGGTFTDQFLVRTELIDSILRARLLGKHFKIIRNELAQAPFNLEGLKAERQTLLQERNKLLSGLLYFLSGRRRVRLREIDDRLDEIALLCRGSASADQREAEIANFIKDVQTTLMEGQKLLE